MAVRREAVRLVLEDAGFSTGMAKNAAATALLGRQLDSLSGSAVRTRTTLDPASQSVDRTGTAARRASPEVDRMSGRLRLMADAAAILGPALVPIGAVAIPAITGLAAQMGAAALGAGTMLVAFQGVGDTLEAVNDAALEPSAENLEAARIAMQNLSPAARDMVRQVQEMRPAFAALRDSAAAGLFPGMVASLEELESVLPNVERVLFAIGDAAGEVSQEFAEGLAGPRGREFLAFLEAEMPSALTELSRTVGNVAAGLAELWMAFTPLNRDFSSWLLDASRGFDDWAQGLAQTEGFRDFIDYVRTNGPRVADALGAMGNALLQIVEAAAPLGGPTLQALEAVADAIAAIAGSDAGPAIMATVTALALLSRGMKTFSAISATSWGTAIKGADTFTGKLAASRGILGRGAAAMAGVALASSDAASGFALTNTASMALMGTLGGPWGAAVGGAIGLMLDLSASSDRFKINSDDLISTLDQQTGAVTRASAAWAATELQQDGVLGAAEALGLSLEDVTQAALGNEDAANRVTTAMEAAKAALFDDQGRPIVGTAELEGFKDNLYTVERGIESVGGATDAGQAKFRKYSEAVGGAGDEIDRTRSAAEQFRASLERLNRMLEGRANMRDYEAALDDFTKGLKENGRSFDINTEKGRLNQANLDNIAATMGRVVEGMKRGDRQATLSQARADIRDMRKQGDLTKAQMDFLLDAVNRLDKSSANPKITADADGAIHIMDLVRAQMQYLDGLTATTYVQTVRRGRVSGGVQEFDGGGYTGRGHHLDPAGVVHRNEVVLPESIVKRDAKFLRERYGSLPGMSQLPGYADGGLVGHRVRVASPSVSVAAPSVSVGGASVRVFIDGSEVRAIVDQRIDDARRFDRRQERRG